MGQRYFKLSVQHKISTFFFLEEMKTNVYFFFLMVCCRCCTYSNHEPWSEYIGDMYMDGGNLNKPATYKIKTWTKVVTSLV